MTDRFWEKKKKKKKRPSPKPHAVTNFRELCSCLRSPPSTTHTPRDARGPGLTGKVILRPASRSAPPSPPAAPSPQAKWGGRPGAPPQGRGEERCRPGRRRACPRSRYQGGGPASSSPAHPSASRPFPAPIPAARPVYPRDGAPPARPPPHWASARRESPERHPPPSD